MKIVKYVKKGNGNYEMLLDSGKKYSLSENLILRYSLLYKKEIDDNLLLKLLEENKKYDIYNKCLKYIAVRLRSVNEIRLFMRRLGVEDEEGEKVILRLIENKMLDDRIFAKAFVKDKLAFTTMGPYRIQKELELHNIDKSIINECIYEIDDVFLEEKINRQINKLMKSNRNKKNLRDRIYKNLLSLGYSSELIVRMLGNSNL